MPWSFQHNKDLQHTCYLKQDWARTCEGRLQSQLNVLSYLYGFLTPVKGLHDFASISGLAFLGVAFLPVHSPRMLWVIGAAWFYTCLPLASHCLQVTRTLWMLWAAWFHTFLPHFCHFSPPVSQCAVGALGRMILLVSDFSPTCLRLVCHSLEALGRMVLQLFPTYLPVCCRCSGPHEPTLLSHIRSRWSGPPESKLVSLVSHLSPTVSKYAVDALGRIILHLYPTCLWMLWAAWFCVCTPLVSHLFLTLGALGHMILHLSPPFLPHLSPGCPPLDSHCLEVRCGCSVPHESTLVSRAAPVS